MHKHNALLYLLVATYVEPYVLMTHCMFIYQPCLAVVDQEIFRIRQQGQIWLHGHTSVHCMLQIGGSGSMPPTGKFLKLAF